MVLGSFSGQSTLLTLPDLRRVLASECFPRKSDAFLTSLDLLPTLGHFIGAKLPEAKIDGKNLSNVLLGKRAQSVATRFTITPERNSRPRGQPRSCAKYRSTASLAAESTGEHGSSAGVLMPTNGPAPDARFKSYVPRLIEDLRGRFK